MNYTKPEVAVLGEATSVIEQRPLLKTQPSVIDPTKFQVTPAYDLDE